MSDASNVSRRRFLKATTFVAGAAALSAASLPIPDATQAQDHGAASGTGTRVFRGRMFLTNDLEFATLTAAAERIFPKDENGPGATDLAVPYFIDNQLAGGYGFNSREYTQGPFGEGAPTQGYQTPLVRRDLMVQGLAALNRQANGSFKNDFPKLSEVEQDQVLTLCQEGKIPCEGFKSAFFFSFLLEMVMGGVYADPIYNGNNNMDGWRMKKYPGAQMYYTQVIESEKFEKIDPMSLADMQ